VFICVHLWLFVFEVNPRVSPFLQESNMSETPGRGALLSTVLVFGIVLAAANAVGLGLLVEHLENPAFTLTGPGFTDKIATVVGETSSRFPGLFALFFLLPVALFAFTAFLIYLRRDPGSATVTAAAPRQRTAAETAAPALQLLAFLQQEGRLLDFVEEEIDGYTDEQVGAAARTIHSGCRKALHERMTIKRLHEADDGATIEVGADYDPQQVRLTGNVHGHPPFRGTLEHGGWRVTDLKLPERTGGDPTIVAPAEVEIL
jgi:hypothetical protein